MTPCTYSCCTGGRGAWNQYSVRAARRWTIDLIFGHCFADVAEWSVGAFFLCLSLSDLQLKQQIFAGSFLSGHLSKTWAPEPQCDHRCSSDVHLDFVCPNCRHL